jgi:predicted flap endonuclease-1-like 5' DNA nuclease
MARTRSTTATKPAAEKVAKPKDKTEAEMMQAAGIVPVEETAEQPKAKKVREVGPATQKVIDQIRELYVDQGLGFPSIAKTLNEEGVKTFRGGDVWHPPVVRGICLRNGWTKGEKKQATSTDA